MFGKKPRELGIPPAVHSDPNALELARIWAAHHGQHVSLNLNSTTDPAEWGLLLVDLARHIANHYHQEHGYPVDKVLQRIRDGFEMEWTSYSTDIDGRVIDTPPTKTDD
jgi:hypothetical protein